MGVRNWRIIVRHILPNMASLLIIDTTLNVGAAILAETGLSFFGFGVQPPDVSLGTLIADGHPSVDDLPLGVPVPRRAAGVIVLCANLVGDGLRDALDPARGRRGRRAQVTPSLRESRDLDRSRFPAPTPSRSPRCAG